MTAARDVDVAILSDIHLGVHACQASRLWDYLAYSTEDILNGDIVDMLQVKRSAWSEQQVRVMRKLLKTLNRGRRSITSLQS